MIEKAELSDKALNQIVEVIKEPIKEKDKEIERLNNIINEAIKRSDELANEIEDLEGSYSYMFIEIINILKGVDK